MFSKDLLLIDIEATGIDAEKHEIIQLAAVLLDKKTLKEKKSFNTYVKPSRWKVRQKEAMAVNKISWQDLKNAPPANRVLKDFLKAFVPQTVILANYGGVLDIVFLRKALHKAKLKDPFDYHVFNIWPLCYAYLATRGTFSNKRKFAGFGLEDLAKKFRLPLQTHDALDDCRLEAAVLRRIMNQQ